jgi:hypothetical protein
MTDITVQFKTARQRLIADLLWEASSKEMPAIVAAAGVDGIIVRDMLIAATFDQFEETDLAERVLVDIMRK